MILTLTFLAGSLGGPLHAQMPWQWADNPNTGDYEAGNGIAVDAKRGMVYVVGVLENHNNFTDITAGEMNAGDGNGQSDGYVAKYDFNGNIQWAFNVGGDGSDEIMAVAVDTVSGNIFVTGHLIGDFSSRGTNLDGHIPGAPGNVTSAFGSIDCFVACYDSAGALVWFEVNGGTGVDSGTDIAVNRNRVFSTGIYRGSASIGGITSDLSYSTVANTYVVAHDLNGNPQWRANAGSDGNDLKFLTNYQNGNRGIACDENAVYMAGYWRGSNFEVRDASNSVTSTFSDPNASAEDLYVLSYDADGSFNWVTLYDDDNSSVFGTDIAVDCDGVYITGSLHDNSVTPGGVTIVSSHDNGIVAGLNKSTGAENWVVQLNSDENHDDYGFAIEADGYGNVYVGGKMKSDPFEVGVPSADTTLTGTNGEDAFLLKLENNGNFQWAERIDGASNDWILGIGLYKNEEVFVTGISRNSLTFPPISLNSSNNDDIFVARKSVIPTGALTTGITIAYGSTNYCASEANPVPALSPGGGTVSEASGNVVFVSTATGEINLSSSTPGGPYEILYTAPSGCFSQTFVTIDPGPTKSNAGPDQIICAATSTLGGNAPAFGTGMWAVVSGPGSVTTPSNPTSGVTGLGIGLNQFEWVITNGGCPPSRDTVDIFVDEPPSASNAGPDQTLCATTATLAANTPTTGTGTWIL
ncbi:MAG: hypothetical protein AAF570_14395, partial [Bacteroidota bacterium]